MQFQVGDRVKHPNKPDWGLGQVKACAGGYVTVHFVEAGVKKLSMDLARLQIVTGEDSISPQLDQICQESRVSAEGQLAAIPNGLLRDYIQGFLGYGSLSAPLWFIGMEEGIGKESLEDRLNAWHDLGHTDTVDIRLFHERIQETRWFSFLARLQRTWRGLIIVALRYLNEPVDKERIRRYQVGELATKTEALLELMPLPHKGLSDWNHQGLFANRDAYLAAIAPKRLAALQKAVASHAPKAVIMYGTTPPYPEYWRKLAGGSLTTTEQGWSHRRSGQTIYVVCQHPVAHGLNDNYYASIGDFIRGASDS